MPRVLLLILDGVGCGAAPDAEIYGDSGADTLGHIFAACSDLRLPTLCSLGLDNVLGVSDRTPRAGWGRMIEQSAGKDSTTGHWELAGVITKKPFAVFDKFPPEIVTALERECGTRFLGNYARSGTVILDELGAAHLQIGLPILYTSADSVMQIAAHENVIPLEQLYEICRAARRIADEWNIGRVIARPFVGEIGDFARTGNRHDFSLVPPRTVLNALCEAGHSVIGVGKVADLFAGSGFSESFATQSNSEGMARIETLWKTRKNGLIFANLVDFDMLFGHRRDVLGFARALEEFDLWLARFLLQLRPDDLLIITADHGNDPTFRGSDHTRETVPLLVVSEFTRQNPQCFGWRASFADVAATLSQWFKIETWPVGVPLKIKDIE